jgi:transposase
MRARIVVAAAGQLTNAEIAALDGVSRQTVTKWRNRFAAQRLRGCWTSHGRAGRAPSPMSRSSRW